MMINLKTNKRNIAREWYEFGLEKGDDFFIKFMMHWIAFNWIYDSYSVYTKEWERIRALSEGQLKLFAKYDAFSTKAYEAFKIKPIMDDRSGSIGKIQQSRYNNMLAHNSIPDLIDTLYQVRCNLFHGSKSLTDDRDIEVVKAASEILEGYLKVYLESENI